MIKVVRIPGTTDRYVARVAAGGYLNGLGQFVRFPESMTYEQAVKAKQSAEGVKA